MRTLLCLLVLVAASMAVAQPDVVVPEEVDATLSGFHEAIVLGDLESAQGYMSTIAIWQAHFAGMGAQGDVMRLAENYVIDSLERRYVSCRASDKRAVVEYDLVMKGAEKKTGEDVELTWRKLARLEARGPHWRILELMWLDPERAARIIQDGILKDEDAGVELAVPEGWRPWVACGGGDLVTTFDAPDLATSITLAAVDLPVSVSAEAIADIEDKSKATYGITGNMTSRGATILGGKDAYQVAGTVEVDDTTIYMRRVYHVCESDARRVVYVLSLATDSEKALDDYSPLFDSLREGIKLTDPRVVELPAELGRIVDGKYVNSTHEVTMNLPEGWRAAISQSRFLFQLVATPPAGESNILLGAVDVGQWVDPKLAVYGDLSAYKAQDPNLTILEEGELDKGTVQGYRMLVQMTLGDNGPRKREIAFFMRGTILYFAIMECVPEAEHVALRPLWDAAIELLSFGPVVEE